MVDRLISTHFSFKFLPPFPSTPKLKQLPFRGKSLEGQPRPPPLQHTLTLRQSPPLRLTQKAQKPVPPLHSIAFKNVTTPHSPPLRQFSQKLASLNSCAPPKKRGRNLIL